MEHKPASWASSVSGNVNRGSLLGGKAGRGDPDWHLVVQNCKYHLRDRRWRLSGKRSPRQLH